MMVASTLALVNLQQAHQQRFTPEASDMAYDMRQQHDGCPQDPSKLFNAQSNSFTSESKYPLPTYIEAVGGSLCDSPSRVDLCFPDGENSGWNSLPDKTLSLYSTYQHSVSESQSQLPLPSKRAAENLTNHYPPNRSVSSMPIGVECENSRYLSSCERFSSHSSKTTNSGIPVDEQSIYASPPHPIQNNCTLKSLPSDKDDNNVLSLSRHRSTSSSGRNSSRSPPAKRSKTPPKSGEFDDDDDDDDDSWKICSVCGDKASGYHFNALTCEGCKGFFRRSMNSRKSFTCPYNGNCSITKSNRRQCQACRLHKCLRIGMKKECIMSRTEIETKKNLMLNNRIKKCVVEWKPTEYTQDKRELVELLYDSLCQTNNPPDIREEDDVITENRDQCASPSSSMHSGFSDLIYQMTQEIVATAPGQSNASKAHLRHFSAIMEFSIKEIIKFCKKIPAFLTLSLKDQITLLKSGCTEILFIKANYTYDRERNALMCGPGKFYTRESFMLGGMSEEYTDSYLKFHHDLSYQMLDDTELACMCAATLFSSDRDVLENRDTVELQQEQIVAALQSYTENIYHCRVRFPKIMAYLTRLRTLNWHISKTLQRLQNTEDGNEITPLVLEVMPTV